MSKRKNKKKKKKHQQNAASLKNIPETTAAKEDKPVPKGETEPDEDETAELDFIEIDENEIGNDETEDAIETPDIEVIEIPKVEAIEAPKAEHTGKTDYRSGDLRQYFFVIRELTAREVKRKYARSSLGIIWSVLNPLLTMAVMSLIFSTMFRHSIEKYPIYLLTGQILWGLFNSATNSAMSSLVDNKGLLIKAKLPKQTFILSRIYTALVNFGYTCIAYCFMLIVFRVKPSASMLLFPVDVILILFFSMGIGYMLSVVYVFFADIKYFYQIFLNLLMYLSALFYPVERLSESMQKVVKMNPVYLMIYFARSCVLYGRIPEREVWVRLILWCAVSLGVGFIIFKRKENNVMQRI